MSPLKAVSVAEAIAAQGRVDYAAWLPQQRWDELERALQAVRDAQSEAQPALDYIEVYGDFFGHALAHGRDALAQLRQWRAQRPDSRFPAMLEVAYWAAWFGEYRSTATADRVTPAMRACARTAQDAMLCAVIRMLDGGHGEWPAIASVLYTEAAFGEPKWWRRWLLKSERPAALPGHGESAEIEAMLAPSGAAAELAEYLRTLPHHLPPPLTAEPLAWRREQPDQDEAALQYWLRVAFALDPHALDAAAAYVSLRMPRWGGSWEEMLAFADSPLCERFDEHERNTLRFFAWFDELEVDDSDLLEDPRVLRHHLRLGQQLLERPLAENLRGRVHKYLAYLEVRNGRIEAACAHYAQSAPHNHYEPWALVRAVSTWCASDDRGPWLGKIAEVNRLVSAHGAALYGLLSINGWAGIERNAQVADGWFELAAAKTDDRSHVPDSPFNALAPLGETLGADALLPMWLKAAALGDASAQFSCGAYFHDERADTERALQYYRQAADNRHEVAMFNVAWLAMAPVREGEVSGAQADAIAGEALDYLERARTRIEEVLQGDHQEFDVRLLDRVRDYFGAILRFDWPPLSARRRAEPHVLEFANDGYLDSMVSLAWWYGDKKLPGYQYDEAVCWVEAARHLQPDSDYVRNVLDFVEGDSFFSRMKFAMAQNRARRRGLPGEGEDAAL